MKLLRVHIISSKTCGGLLDGLNVDLRSPFKDSSSFAVFDPLCLIGPNGAGKSQFLQVIAEIFQSVFQECIGEEERGEVNPDLRFEIEYFIYPEANSVPVRVQISRRANGKKRSTLIVQKREGYVWIDCNLNAVETRTLLPNKIIGYTSGDNETLSRPFLISRRGYAGAVGTAALHSSPDERRIPDTRLMLIDYGTNFEVLVANLLLGNNSQWKALLGAANLRGLHSFRCIIQLAHSAAPNNPKKREGGKRPNEVLITPELEDYLEKLKCCSTCYAYEDKTKTYTFDYWINDETREAFRYFWDSALSLYASFHKFAMLNDLVLPKNAREFFQNKSSDFAERPPEPQKEDKVFRFEWVRFINEGAGKKVGYVSLSDGEHQLMQILSTLCMLSSPNILFLLDEPESHFNPQWRVKFISKILDLPTNNGNRREISESSKQDFLLTTHSPFVPSDMHKEKVFIFSKNVGEIEVDNPDIETFGATFDTIIEKCFHVRPPISQVSRDQINELMASENPEEIREGIQHLGSSVEKAFLADRIRELKNKNNKDRV
jgi:restriction system-associated AAA family ATPase